MRKRPRNYDLPLDDFNEDSNPNLSELDDMDYVGITDFTYENDNLYPEDTLNQGFDLIQSSNGNLQNPEDPELFD